MTRMVPLPPLIACTAITRLATSLISRRGLIALAGLGLTALGTAGWRNRAANAMPARGERSMAPDCVLTPEQTEGPYYIPGELMRANIVEHRPGVPLTLQITVLDASTCAPLAGAAVDIWHCDATGIYSGFERASAGGAPGGAAGPTDHDTFLRGIQMTDAHGRCRFQTIYPGWYRGRTTHIHVKVHVGGSVVHTGQLYFPDSLTSKVYQSEPYRARASQRDTWNATDSIFRDGGAQSMLAITHTGHGGYVGTIALGVRRA